MRNLVREYDSANETRLEDCTVDNEQERELAHEIERQRRVERPKAIKACWHTVAMQHLVMEYDLMQKHLDGTGFTSDVWKLLFPGRQCKQYSVRNHWREGRLARSGIL